MRICLIFLMAFFLSGCSVMMALSGKKDANVSMLEVGQSRDIVIANLGQPTKTVSNEDGTYDVFELQRGNSPSAGRAMGHAALDLLTFFFWEIPGTAIEAAQGETFTMSIQYDKDNKIKKVTTGESQLGAAL